MTKTILLPHFSDTIADGDVTVARLQEQYRCIASYLIESLNYEPFFIGSEFGNSEQTSRQVLGFIDFLCKNPETRGEKIIICANNASRAKHENREQAKGSDCLLSQITSPEGKEIYVVGVDDEVFKGLSNSIIQHRKIKNIKWNGKVKEDISQGSQFRSLEYRPLIQFLLSIHPKKDRDTYIDREEIAKPEVITTEHLTRQKEDLPSYELKNGAIGIEQYLPSVHNTGDDLLYEEATNRQVIGQREFFAHERDFPFTYTPQEEVYIIKFKEIVEGLRTNEILFIGRDKFGNAKFLSKHKDGVHGIVKTINSSFGKKVDIRYTDQEGNDISIGAFHLAESLGKYTGENCLWNGSSRGPERHKIVELGHSYGPQSTNKAKSTLQKLDTLQTGTKLIISIPSHDYTPFDE